MKLQFVFFHSAAGCRCRCGHQSPPSESLFYVCAAYISFPDMPSHIRFPVPSLSYVRLLHIRRVHQLQPTTLNAESLDSRRLVNVAMVREGSSRCFMLSYPYFASAQKMHHFQANIAPTDSLQLYLLSVFCPFWACVYACCFKCAHDNEIYVGCLCIVRS